MSKYIIVDFIYIIFCTAMFFALGKKDCDFLKKRIVIFSVLAAAFAVRVVLAFRNEAYWFDVGCFKDWADLTFNPGISEMYNTDTFLDYPPGYMYILYVIKRIGMAFSLDKSSIVYTALIKMPAVLADIFTAIFVYKVAKNNIGEKWAVFASAAIAFCPVLIFNSAVWGQIDSYYTLLLVISIYLLAKDKICSAAVVYAITLLTKPQALLFGPVLLFRVLRKKDFRVALKAISVGLFTMVALALPFSDGMDIRWLPELYFNTMSGYKYLTLNAFNLYGLLGFNYIPLENVAFAKYINLLVIPVTFIICMYGYFNQKGEEKIFYNGAMFITVFFTFCTMMHERYIIPVLLLTVICFAITKRTYFFLMFLWSSTFSFMNITAIFVGGYDTKGVLPLPAIAVCILCTLFALTFITMFAADTIKHKNNN